MIASDTTIANSWNSPPITPGMKKIGMNTATSDTEIEKMVKAISLAPSTAASKGSMPPSTWRTMFSSMTMASSTTSPTASVMPRSETLSRLRFNARMSASVPMSEIGSESVGMMVADGRRRKRKITSTTSTAVMASVTFTSWIAARIETERSLRIWMLIDAGICAMSPGIAARMASTVATVLASGWRCTCRLMICSPPEDQLAVFTFSTLSCTSATSSRRTVLPPGSVATMILANSAARVICLLAWMVSVWRVPSSVPTGVLALAFFSAVAMSSMVRLRAASASGRMRTRTA